ncbi:MAG: T9SS type A sorting domain-containing protein [Bacteroidales bacterium]|nr:T9SS type A sorting domain-containing protein [Bacteroidales bacterium]MCF8458590.1 T9SS type A sorting domain-containing protein [Bacteroidales bacterium]
MKKLVLLLLLSVAIFDFAYCQTVNSVKSNNKTFIENKGQWPENVVFLTRQNNFNAWFVEDGIIYDFFKVESSNVKSKPFFVEDHQNNSRKYGHVVKMKFGNCKDEKKLDISGNDKLSTYYNYFIGNDQAKWASRVGLFSEIQTQNLYEYINLRHYFTNEGLRYDFIVNPGGDISDIEISFEGADDLKLNDRGELEIFTSLGIVKHCKLVAFQKIDEMNVEVPVSFELKDSKIITFSAESYDKSKPLIIDPLVVCSFFGGWFFDWADDIIFDNNSNVIIGGSTQSNDFPISLGAYSDSINGDKDLIISKFTSNIDTLLFSTFLGASNGFEYFEEIISDSFNNTIICGNTSGSDFPTTSGAYDEIRDGSSDGFIAKINTSGDSLLNSTLLGGDASDVSFSISIGTMGDFVVTGGTTSLDLACTSNAYDNSYNENGDVFIARFDSELTTLLYCTYLGGSKLDAGLFIDYCGNDTYIITGSTKYSDFPTTPGSFSTPFCDDQNIFVSKISGDSLIFSTYFGGGSDDELLSSTIDLNGDVIVAGKTISFNYPTSNGCFDSIHSNLRDGFISKLASDGTYLKFSTFIGGDDIDEVTSVTTDTENNIYFTGSTESPDIFIPSNNCYDSIYNGNLDVIIGTIDTSGNNLLYASFLGKSESEWGYGIALHEDKYLFLTGVTYSVDFPVTSGVIDTSLNGSFDIFLFKMNLPFVKEVVTQPSCYGETDAAINLTFTGGTSPYVIQWDNGATDQFLDSLPPGNYNVTIIDAEQLSTEISIDVIEPDLFTVAANYDPIHCNGDSTLVTFNFTGGTPPYSYPHDTILWAGSHVFSFVDSRGCEAMISFVINDPPVLEFTSLIMDASAPSVPDGSINITVSGGITPYSYNWFNGSQTEDIENLVPSEYYVTITDFLNCQLIESFTVNYFIGLPELEEQHVSLMCYPNPFSEKTTVSFTLSRSANIELALFNILGEKIQILWEGYSNQGEHSFEFRSGDFSSGTYLIKLETNNSYSRNMKIAIIEK